MDPSPLPPAPKPYSLLEGLSRSASRTVGYFLVGGVLAWLLPALPYPFRGRWYGFYLGLTGAFFTAVTLLLWRKRFIGNEAAARMGLGISLGCLFLESLLIGQGDSQSAWYMVAISLAAGYLLRGPEIVVWAGVTAIFQALLRVGEFVWPLRPEYVISGWELTMGQVILTALCAIFAFLSRSMADDRLRQVIARENYILEQSKLLEQARDQAVAASLAQSRFLSTVSHEIRTPLYGILGAAQGIKVEGLKPRDRESVVTIVSSGELLLSVLNDVLDSAKLDADELSLHYRGFNLADTLQAACRLVRPLTERKGLELDLELAEGLPTHWLGDDLRIRQIILNLLNNACKFSVAGRILVRAEGETGGLKLLVQDEGIGISEADQARLFQPFRQVIEGDDRRHDGTGLGLWIVRRLASLMKGEITLESSPGKGSTFTVWLPLVATAGGKAVVAAKAVTAKIQLKVLVVDDNPVNRKVTVNLLKRLGHSADAVEGGREAIEAVGQARYDVVMMDLQMPEMDGVAATRAIRSLDGIEQPRVVAFSADAQGGRKLEIGPHTFDAFLSKPLRGEQLGECLESLDLGGPKEDDRSDA